MTELRRSLGPVMLWGLGVGYVISGNYFGWNLGLPLAGTYGMLAATLLVTLLYLTFSLSYAELACALPRAGGALEFGLRAFGTGGGVVLGTAQAVEFLFAPPAIAAAIGEYFSTFAPSVPPKAIAIGAYVVFTAVNIAGVRLAASFELAVTVLAIAELLLFMGITGPHFSFERFGEDPLPRGWAGVLDALPFAIWFYLGIEGVANAAEEARNPERDVARGLTAAIATLVLLALGVFVCSVGVAGWHAVVYPAPGAPPSDRPLPLALGHIVPATSALYHLLVSVGLLGLIASFHGIVLAGGRATFELGRAGFAPRALARVSPRTGTPAVALVANMAIGIAAILSGTTGALITMSVLGALALYVGSMAALFALRQREPALPRPFRAVAYPVFPGLALVLSIVCLVAVARANLRLALGFLGVLAIAWLFGRWRKAA